jgi:hypothetical protein
MLDEKKIAELKAEHGSDLAGVQAADGTVLVFRKPKRVEYDRWFDRRAENPTTSARELATCTIVYPDSGTMVAGARQATRAPDVQKRDPRSGYRACGPRQLRADRKKAIAMARVDTARAARCLVSLFHGGDPEDAYVGAVLIAEGLRTLRDWDSEHFNRSW